jgi:hypothetical protein
MFRCRGRDSHGPRLFVRLASSLALSRLPAGLLNRLAAATDLQQLLPPATADLGALADSLGVLWVVLFHLQRGVAQERRSARPAVRRASDRGRLAAVAGIGGEPEVTPRGCYVPASACRPMSAIVSQVTLIGRPSASTVPASPSRGRPAPLHLNSDIMVGRELGGRRGSLIGAAALCAAVVLGACYVRDHSLLP